MAQQTSTPLILVHVLSTIWTCGHGGLDDEHGFCATRQFVLSQVENTLCAYCRTPLLWETEPCNEPEHYRKAKEYYASRQDDHEDAVNEALRILGEHDG